MPKYKNILNISKRWRRQRDTLIKPNEATLEEKTFLNVSDECPDLDKIDNGQSEAKLTLGG